jgi:hypothetical protein
MRQLVLGLRVKIPLEVWKSVCCECSVLSGIGPCARSPRGVLPIVVSFTSALDWGEWLASRSGPLPPAKRRYPLYKRLVGSRAGMDRY